MTFKPPKVTSVVTVAMPERSLPEPSCPVRRSATGSAEFFMPLRLNGLKLIGRVHDFPYVRLQAKAGVNLR